MYELTMEVLNSFVKTSKNQSKRSETSEQRLVEHLFQKEACFLFNL